MVSKRILGWVSRVAAGAGLLAVAAAPVQAEPLWPGGPNIPGAPMIIAPEAPCTDPVVRACLRKATNEFWLMENGRVVHGPSPMNHGMPGFETPAGMFDVDFKRPFHWSTLHNAPMRWATFFNGGIAFHVGPVWAQSHGCIRQTEDGAHRTFEHLNVGDIVQVL